jgi:hypothetical protein
MGVCILANLQLASHPVSPGLVVVIVAWAIIALRKYTLDLFKANLAFNLS